MPLRIGAPLLRVDAVLAEMVVGATLPTGLLHTHGILRILPILLTLWTYIKGMCCNTAKVTTPNISLALPFQINFVALDFRVNFLLPRTLLGDHVQHLLLCGTHRRRA